MNSNSILSINNLNVTSTVVVVVVDVAFKLFIDNIEFVDKLFKLLKVFVDVKFILLMDVAWPFRNP